MTQKTFYIAKDGRIFLPVGCKTNPATITLCEGSASASKACENHERTL